MNGYNDRKQFPISPMKVKFTQDSIAMCFQNEDQVNQTCERIAKGELTVDVFPPIRVLPLNGEMFSVDNRRLYVFRVLNLLGLLQSIVVRRVQQFDREITTENEGCHVRVRSRRDNNQRWQKVETFRHCFCEEGIAKRLPRWWNENLKCHVSLIKSKFPHPKSNVSRFPTVYSISSNHSDIEDARTVRHGRKSISAADNLGQGSNSYVNTFKERVVTAVPREINSSRFPIEDTKPSTQSFKTKPSRHGSYRTGSNTSGTFFETDKFLPMPTTFRDSRYESRPSRVPSTKRDPTSNFEKYVQPHMWPAALNSPYKQLRAGTPTDSSTSERDYYDNVFSNEFRFKQNRNLVTSQPKSTSASRFDRNMPPEVAIRSFNRPTPNHENRNGRQQESPDQDCCLTSCCAGLYDLMMSCVSICDEDHN